MTESAHSSPKGRSFWTIPWYVVASLLFAFMMMGADFSAITLGPVRALGIPYSRLLDYSPVIICVFCGVVWIVLRPFFPRAAGIGVILLCGFLITSIPHVPSRYVVELPVTREWTKAESATMEADLGIKSTWQNSSSEGMRIFVAKEQEANAREALGEMGILRK